MRQSGRLGDRGGLLLSYLVRGFVSLPTNDPFPVVCFLEFLQGQSQLLNRVEVPDPEQVFLRVRTKRSAIPLPYGSRT